MNQRIEAAVQAEYNPAKVIVMHTPGEELFYGALQGIAALFEEEPFDRFKVIDEHKGYVNKLKDLGVEVILLNDVLLEGTIDESGNKIRGQALEDLVAFAEKSLSISYPIELPIGRLGEMQGYKHKTMESFHPKDLVKIILERPKISIRINDEGNTNLIAEIYSAQPVMNLHFLRDQQITGDKGIIMGKMNSTQRRPETEITKFVFRKLGIDIIYEIKGHGRLEGGDFIPCGNYALLGQGLRTNEEGIKQLLENDVFNYPEIAVIKDSYKQQDEMHLDTYFNIVGPNKAVVLEDRVTHYDKEGKLVEPEERKRLFVDVYSKKGNSYVKSESGVRFEDYLKRKGFGVEKGSLITISKKEQLAYGINFLTISPNKIVVASCAVTEEYRQKMGGIELIEVDLGTFVKTYGAPHCATQVICRSK